MTTETKKRKLLIVLNYWNGDRDMALKLADLIADLEPSRNMKADFMFHRRFDAEKMPSALKDRLSEKFEVVHDIKCRRMNAVGYPYGPNEMFYDLVERMNNREYQMDYYAFLNMEADCCPLSPDWIDKMIEAYDEAYHERKSATGHVVTHASMTHLNGVAIYSIDFWSKAGGMNIIGGPANEGYDTYHANRVMPISKDTSSILLDFNRKTINEEDIGTLSKNGQRPYLFHGVKDMSAIVAVRNKYIKHIGSVITPESLKTICTYYDLAPENNQNQERALIELWKSTWKAFGYNPVVFTEWDASKNPVYARIKDKLRDLKPTKSRKQESALLYRWLAFEYYGGGLMTEYDVFPGNSFTSNDVPAPEAINLLEGNVLSSVSADRRGLRFFTEMMDSYDYSKLTNIPSDKQILGDLDQHFWIRKSNITRPWNSDKWAEGKLVHFSYAACRTVSAAPNKQIIIDQYLKTINP